MPTSRKTGRETFLNGCSGSTLAEFWAWSGSCLLGNLYRGWLAEFIVGKALCCLDETRQEWDRWDLKWRGLRIEVRSSSYVQSWRESEVPWVPTFSIRPPEPDEKGELPPPRKVNSDIYVFALLGEKGQNADDVNPLDMRAWRFWVVATETIDATLGRQKRARLSTLQARGARFAVFGDLPAVAAALL